MNRLEQKFAWWLNLSFSTKSCVQTWKFQDEIFGGYEGEFTIFLLTFAWNSAALMRYLWYYETPCGCGLLFRQLPSSLFKTRGIVFRRIQHAMSSVRQKPVKLTVAVEWIQLHIMTLAIRIRPQAVTHAPATRSHVPSDTLLVIVGAFSHCGSSALDSFPG